MSTRHRPSIARLELFSLKLFGSAFIETPDGPLLGRAAQRHRIALLALLDRARHRGLSRDRLIGLLWPDTETERARRLLSDSAYRINNALGGEVIVAAGEDLRLTDRLKSDVTQFEEMLESGDARAAAALYAGPFLDGFAMPTPELEQWADAERERLRLRYTAALEQLADQAEAQGDNRQACDWLRLRCNADRFSTEAALRLIATLERRGERAAALQHARQHETILREELGVDASPALQSAITALMAPAAPVARLARDPLPAPETDAPVVSAPAAPQAGLSPLSRRRRYVVAAWFLLAGVLGLAGVVGVATFSKSRLSSVAVMPFADHSAGGTHQYFSDGLTEELINSLSRVAGLRVAPRTSAFAFRSLPYDVREIGRRLNVESVLEGSVREADGQLRIAVQLVDARNGFTRWSETYNRPARDILAVQEEIGRAIVENLKGSLLATEAAAVSATPVDTGSYRLYLKGRYHWHRRGRDDVLLAVDHFKRVTEQSPTFARGWAGLADAYAICGFYDYLPPHDAFPKAEQAARRALDLDVSLAAAHATLGYVELYYRWHFPRAEQQFKRAIQLDPRYSTAEQWYGNMLTAAGRFDEAEQAMQRAELLDPLSLIASAAHGWSLYYARRFDAANQQLVRTIGLDSTFTLAHLWRGFVLESLGQLDSMQASFQRSAQYSNSAIQRTAIARGLALRGERAAALDELRALEQGKYGYAPEYELAKIHLGLGDQERALTLLESAVQQGAHSIAFLNVDPQLDPLRSSPRFERLRARLTTR